MKKILIIGLLILTTLIIACNPDEPTPPKLDCDNTYPVYESVIADYEPTFEWCEIGNAESYRFQLSKLEDFSELLHETDTIVNQNIVTLSYIITHSSGYSTWILNWGTKYYWRIAAIKDSVQQDWSNTYIFETNDIRDDIVGSYEAKKQKFWLSHHGNPTYYDSVYSIHQIEVEKLPDSRGIRVKDITSGDFDIELSRAFGLYSWAPQYQVYTGGEFKIDVDSFEIRNVPCDSPADLPCIGYRYSGRE